MQHFKQINWKKFFLQGVLPCLLAVAVGFISRYQLELSDGVTPSFLELQWPLYAPLNALTAFCLTLILFAVLGKWSCATGISGAVFTVIALINYYTRDLHGSALMPQDILNLGTAAEVMGSYTLKITKDVVTIALLYLPILAIAFVQAQLVKGAPKHASWKMRGVRMASRVRERLARHGHQASAHIDGRSALKGAVNVHVSNAALAGKPVELHAHVDGRVLQCVDARTHGGKRLAQAVRKLAKLLDGGGVIAVHHLERLHLEHQPGELVAHGVVDLSRDARALGQSGGVGLVRARIL